MNYHEACQATVSRREALAEIQLHQADIEDFLATVGDREEYQGSEVLRWLGY